MSDHRALPDRPDPRRLRDEAKARKRSGEFESLTAAQFALAREYGFASWPRLKAFVATRSLDQAARAAALIRSACSSDLRTARTLLDAEPELARFDLATACVTGEVAEVARRLARDPAAVHRRGGPLDWEPLLYATFSRFLRAEPTRGIVEVVRRLLEAGADPNVMWFEHEYRQLPVYAAAGIANNAELTRMLLAAGADPNETYDDPDRIGEALYHAAEFPDPTCARLLIEAGTLPNRVSYCLGRALDFPNESMVDMFLAHGAVPSGAHLRHAVAFGRPVRTVRALLDAGGPADQPDHDGVTALRLAVRRGQDDVAALLRDRGARSDRVTDADRTWGEVMAGSAVMPASRADPELLEQAAHLGDVEAVRRLLAAGAAVDGTPDHHPLRQATWRGHADVVRELVAHGAALNWPHGSPIGSTLHGALHCQDPQGGPTMRTVDEIDHGDYPEVLRILLEAGARIPDGLWDPDLDAAELLAAFGVVDGSWST